MFSVPGWNVSAPLTAQIEKPKAKDANREGKKSKNSKKRKRQEDEQINEENLGQLLSKMANGGKDVAIPQLAVAVAGEGLEKVEAAPETVTKKPRKRSKKKKEDVVESDGPMETTAQAENNDDITKENIAAGTGADTETPTTLVDTVRPDAEVIAQARRDKKKRKEENRAAKQAQAASEPAKPPAPSKPIAAISLIPEPPGLTPMQRSMRTKLASARFRHLNESLYTKPSKESLEIFKETPSMFEDYHRGFAQQVEVWPSNPVDEYVSTIIARGKARTKDPWKDKKRALKKKGSKQSDMIAAEEAPPPSSTDIKPLPRNIKGVCTIADLGCGIASLSHTLQPHLKPLTLAIHSFDLARPTGPSGPLVTIADISALPLPDNSIDVAVFCLALMGTNWLDFIDEAYRILRWRGELWISEIKSRFGRVGGSKGRSGGPGKPPPNSVGLNRKPDKKAPKPRNNKNDGDVPEGAQDSSDEAELAQRIDGNEGREGTDVSTFVEVLRKHGFALDALPEKANDAIDLSNKMFVKMQFTKSVPPTKGKNAKKVEEKKGFGTGKPDQRMMQGIKGKKYQAVAGVDDDGNDEQDAKVLKPCLYKIR